MVSVHVHWGVFPLLEAAPIIKYIQFYLTKNEDLFCQGDVLVS